MPSVRFWMSQCAGILFDVDQGRFSSESLKARVITFSRALGVGISRCNPIARASLGWTCGFEIRPPEVNGPLPSHTLLRDLEFKTLDLALIRNDIRSFTGQSIVPEQDEPIRINQPSTGPGSVQQSALRSLETAHKQARDRSSNRSLPTTFRRGARAGASEATRRVS